MIKNWMVEIPPGSINLRDNRKKTSWSCRVSPFLMSKYLITQKIYASVTSSSPSTFQGYAKPVESVSWFDAILFCNNLSDLTGLEKSYDIDRINERVDLIHDSDGYRLPSDAEWEFSCRAGSNKVQYNNIDDIAWYERNSSGATHDVGLKLPNDFGLYDMLGNVWEWCLDMYDPDVYGAYRVFRGGGWSDDSRGCLASNRRRSHPIYKMDDLGFRVARSIKSELSS